MGQEDKKAQALICIKSDKWVTIKDKVQGVNDYTEVQNNYENKTMQQHNMMGG